MRPSRTETLWLILAAFVAGLLRLVLAARLPIGDDEAYYWLWAQRLAWSYPDHPPMIAAVVALSTWFFGDGALGVRALSVLMAAITPLVVYLAARSMFDHAVAVRATLISLILPAFAIGTAFAFPDTPLALFWALALWAGWRALQAGGWWWVAAGAATGLALLGKLTAFALVLGFAGTLAAGDWRRALRDPGLYVGALVAAALFAPVVLWNARHSWALLQITLTREPWMMPRSVPENLGFFLAGQVGYYGVLAPALIAAGIAALRRSGALVWRYLAWMSLPLLAVTAIAALDARPKPHWPGPAYIAAGLALAALWEQWVRRRPRALRAAAGLTALMTVTIAAVLFLPWGTEQLENGIGRWDRVAEAVKRLLAAQKGPALVLTDTYQAASHIAYRLRSRAPVTTTYGAFDVWRGREWTGWTGIYVDEPVPTRHLRVQEICGAIRPVEQVELAPGRVVGLYLCDDVRFP